MPTRIELIDEMAAALARRATEIGAVTVEQSAGLMLVLTEALINAVVHGNLGVSSELKERDDDAFARAVAQRSNDPRFGQRAVDIRVVYDGRQIAWTVTDQGGGFDAPAHLRRLDSEPVNLDRPSGRGIMLMRAMTDHIEWSQDGRQVRFAICRGPRERRSRPRTPLKAPVRVIPLDDSGSIDWQKAFSALAVDASDGGLGLLQSHPQAARRLLVEIAAEGRVVYLPASVCHVRHLGDSLVQIGCRFADDQAAPGPDSQAARQRLAELVEQAQADRHSRPSGNDNRQHVRAAYTKTIQVQSGSDPAPAAKLSRDLSLGGMAFLSRQPMGLGQTVEINFVEERPLMERMKARVIRCLRLAEDMHDVGVKFL